MTKIYDHYEHIAFLKARVRATEVVFKYGSESQEILLKKDPGDWLSENIGQRRLHNIYQEARSGWLDYFEGEWSVYDRSGYLMFWFNTQLQAAKFMLMFGGSAGAGMPELD